MNGAWRFGVEWGGENNLGNIFSYSIGANGALTQKDTYTAPSQNGQAISIWLDHTSSTLYADANSGDANDFLGLSIDQSTNALTEMGDLSPGPRDEGPLSFIGNNAFAYTSFVYELQGGTFLGVQIASDGALFSINNFRAPSRHPRPATLLAGKSSLRPDQPSCDRRCTDCSENGNTSAGAAQLASYTAESDGSLTTNSTWEIMPNVLVGTIYDH